MYRIKSLKMTDIFHDINDEEKSARSLYSSLHSPLHCKFIEGNNELMKEQKKCGLCTPE